MLKTEAVCSIIQQLVWLVSSIIWLNCILSLKKGKGSHKRTLLWKCSPDKHKVECIIDIISNIAQLFNVCWWSTRLSVVWMVLCEWSCVWQLDLLNLSSRCLDSNSGGLAYRSECVRVRLTARSISGTIHLLVGGHYNKWKLHNIIG